MCLKLLVVANSVDPDQTPHSVASDMALHCLLKFVNPKILFSSVLKFRVKHGNLLF